MPSPEKLQPEHNMSGPLRLPGRLVRLSEKLPRSDDPFLAEIQRELSRSLAAFDNIQEHGTPDTPRNPVFHRSERS